MTVEGSALCGAQWKIWEAKIIEVPAIPDAMPEFTTTYDIDPHAGEDGFDDSAWPTIAPTALGAKRGRPRVAPLVSYAADDPGVSRRLRSVGSAGGASAVRRR
jgi:hypothetical protein